MPRYYRHPANCGCYKCYRPSNDCYDDYYDDCYYDDRCYNNRYNNNEYDDCRGYYIPVNITSFNGPWRGFALDMGLRPRHCTPASSGYRWNDYYC